MRAVILIEDDQQDQEVSNVRDCLRVLGWETLFAGRVSGDYYTGKHGIRFKADCSFHSIMPDDWEAVIIPGGWGAEKLRTNPYVISFVKAVHVQGKVVAAICHGPWCLCSADICKQECGNCCNGMVDARVTGERQKPCSKCKGTGRKRIKATCYKGMKDDLIAAGAEYVEAPVVVDGNIVTSPHYDNVPEFCKAIHDTIKIKESRRVG